jgi:hypothetical protein
MDPKRKQLILLLVLTAVAAAATFAADAPIYLSLAALAALFAALALLSQHDRSRAAERSSGDQPTGRPQE